jgi:RNA polymerase sigma-70 factor (ECF subfamily)
MQHPTEHNATPGERPDRARQFVELLARNERRLSQYVLALVPNWADADDLVQQTKVRLWEQFDEYDPSKDFGAWACTIAHYLVLAHRKQTQRRHARLSNEYVRVMAAEVERLAADQDARRSALEECLKQLTEGSRRLIGLCYGGSRTIKDVAEQLNRSVGATQKAVYRIRQKLQTCIEQRLAKEGQR